jgi:hypothetical protein
MNLFLYRHPDQTIQTKGLLDVVQNGKIIFTCLTLELPWKDNQRNISCYPLGEYNCSKHISPTFGESILVHNVPGRTEILIHPANYAGSKNPNTGRSDLKGCTAVGEKFVDINGDGIPDITGSKKMMTKLLKLLPDVFTLRVELAQNEELVRLINQSQQT